MDRIWGPWKKMFYHWMSIQEQDAARDEKVAAGKIASAVNDVFNLMEYRRLSQLNEQSMKYMAFENGLRAEKLPGYYENITHVPNPVECVLCPTCKSHRVRRSWDHLAYTCQDCKEIFPMVTYYPGAHVCQVARLSEMSESRSVMNTFQWSMYTRDKFIQPTTAGISAYSPVDMGGFNAEAMYGKLLVQWERSRDRVARYWKETKGRNPRDGNLWKPFIDRPVFDATKLENEFITTARLKQYPSASFDGAGYPTEDASKEFFRRMTGDGFADRGHPDRPGKIALVGARSISSAYDEPWWSKNSESVEGPTMVYAPDNESASDYWKEPRVFMVNPDWPKHREPPKKYDGFSGYEVPYPYMRHNRMGISSCGYYISGMLNMEGPNMLPYDANSKAENCWYAEGSEHRDNNDNEHDPDSPDVETRSERTQLANHKWTIDLEHYGLYGDNKNVGWAQGESDEDYGQRMDEVESERERELALGNDLYEGVEGEERYERVLEKKEGGYRTMCTETIAVTEGFTRSKNDPKTVDGVIWICGRCDVAKHGNKCPYAERYTGDGQNLLCPAAEELIGTYVARKEPLGSKLTKHIKDGYDEDGEPMTIMETLSACYDPREGDNTLDNTIGAKVDEVKMGMHQRNLDYLEALLAMDGRNHMDKALAAMLMSGLKLDDISVITGIKPNTLTKRAQRLSPDYATSTARRDALLERFEIRRDACAAIFGTVEVEHHISRIIEIGKLEELPWLKTCFEDEVPYPVDEYIHNEHSMLRGRWPSGRDEIKGNAVPVVDTEAMKTHLGNRTFGKHAHGFPVKISQDEATKIKDWIDKRDLALLENRPRDIEEGMSHF